LIIAGSALALDIDFENNVVKKVALSFPENPESVTRHAKAAGDILLRDLQFGPCESPLTKKLDRFAANLERLATLDKLSVIPGLNCHEAIAGIFQSLERLHLWEVERLKESQDMSGKTESLVVATAVYTKSGRPVMHSRDRLGMSLDYWEEKRYEADARQKKPYALLIECAPLPSLVYPPLRVSEHWISAGIQKENPPAEELFLAPSSGPILDWLQPDNTLLPATESKVDEMEGVDHTSHQKFPEVMFVAKFDPPIVAPSNIAIQIYNTTGMAMDPFPPTSYDELLVPRQSEETPDQDKRQLRRDITIPVVTMGEKSSRVHNNTLYIEKRDYGRVLNEIPFSHPQQLVEWLPALRQAAFLGSVLRSSFGPRSRPHVYEKRDEDEESLKREFSAFMSGKIATKASRIDIKLDTQPVPRLDVNFPFKRAIKDESVNSDGIAHIVFEIKPNAGVEIVSRNFTLESLTGNAAGEGKKRELTDGDLARMLELTEDLGVWVEYVKRRLG
jgi:hypothetical protein